MANVLEHYRSIFGALEPVQLLLAFCLLSLGLISGPMVLRRGIRPLCAYPLWILGRIERLLKDVPSAPTLFALIFTLNSVSLTFNLLSGTAIVLPPLLALLLGLNLGVVLARMTDGRVLLPLLLNPVAWLEIPAAVLSLAGGMRIAAALRAGYGAPELRASLLWGGELYLWVIMPLLLVAALLEAWLISRWGGEGDLWT